MNKRLAISIITATVITGLAGLVIGVFIGRRPASVATPQPTAAASVSPVVPSGSPLPSTTAGFCATDNLRLAVQPADAAAGSQIFTLQLTNIGATACQLAGFPGVSLLDADGRQVGPDADRETTSSQPVVGLTTGQAVNAQFRLPVAANFEPGVCGGQAAQIRVYPPGNTTALTTTFNAQACPGWSVQAVTGP